MGILSGVDSFINSVINLIFDAWSYIVTNPDAIAFLILMVITTASAIFVVISKEVVHSAFYLALVAVCIAVTYFFLEAEFVGVVQLMVYVGAVTIVFVFSIMLTRTQIIIKEDDGNE
ncbi:MAG: NADH-quinone oxidoreductase subunit J [Methanomassiliicoccaceae archaeon]|jgi:NADH-quinone oxidoreductase subunit J|nr:NADH-quinone oxidoreductase subunit J [Methanomassiliicoccaceae archaeon]